MRHVLWFSFAILATCTRNCRQSEASPDPGRDREVADRGQSTPFAAAVVSVVAVQLAVGAVDTDILTEL